MEQQLFVTAYYNDSISNKDNGYQVNLMYYKEGSDDYSFEEYITTASPTEAKELANQINKNGYENFKPKN